MQNQTNGVHALAPLARSKGVRTLRVLIVEDELAGSPISMAPDQPQVFPKTLYDIKQSQQESEREYILSILKKTKGRIQGRNGAAELLNLKPTTLESRMQRLGISKVNI